MEVRHLVKVTISGHPGSGTSTLVEGLCNHFGWSSLNGGQLFRDEANNRGLSLADFGALCAEDDSVDRHLDEVLKQKMLEENGPEVMESRLCGWWAYNLEINCVRLWINVSDDERAVRVVNREGGNLAQAIEDNRKRSAIDLSRYQELYGLDPQDATPYTHVIEATSLRKEKTLAEAVAILEEVE
jgi:predicted cytidylate kinase